MMIETTSKPSTEYEPGYEYSFEKDLFYPTNNPQEAKKICIASIPRDLAAL